MDQQQIDQLETEESMFVQTASGITSDVATLTLRDVTPSMRDALRTFVKEDDSE